MKSNVTTDIVVTLVLSREEAEWLHALVQNPLIATGPVDPDREHPADAAMRRKFWEATKTD